MAFEMFADAYPHEAAEADWPEFVAYVRRRRGDDLPEGVIRNLLASTAEAEISDWEMKQS